MKKVFAAIFSIIAVLTFAYSVNADKLPDGDFRYQDLEDSAARIAYMPDSEQKYVVDFEDNILGGPYKDASDYGSYIHAENYDGSYVMFDHDGSVLAQASATESIFYPANGLYAIAHNLPFGEDYDLCDEFDLYDYSTREKLCTLDKVILFYLEQQNEKMVVEKDGKHAFINKYGELQSDYVYDEIKKRFNPDYEPYPKAYAIVVQDGVEKYLDWDLNEIVFDESDENPFITNTYSIYDEESNRSERYRVLESNSRYGVYDFVEQRYIVPLQTEYTGFPNISGDYLTVQKDDKFGLIDIDGNVISPPEYSYLHPIGSGMFIYNKVSSETSEITEHGIFKGEKVVYSSSDPSHARGQITDALNGAVIITYPDPNESYEYAHNYTDYVYEIVNFAGHSLNGELYTHAYISDGEIYATHDYHSSTPTFEKVDIARDFAVINLNGEYLPFDGVIRNSRTLVPMREIVEGLGGTVDWNGDTQSVHAVIDGKEIDLSIGSNIMTVNGTDETLDVAAQIINDKTMLPLRAVSEAVGAEVDWDEQIRCVYIKRS